jgi:hypothetical protein
MGNRRLILDEQEIIRLYVNEGKSALQISKIMGCSVMAIFRRLYKNNIEIKSQSVVMSGRKLTKEHRDKVIKTLRYGQIGSDNPAWKGGRSYTISNQKKYILILINGKYIKEHRWVMEQHIGRKLLRSEDVHHKDGNTLNNSIDNLEILTKSEHAHYHNDSPEMRHRKSEKMKLARANRYWSTKKK